MIVEGRRGIEGAQMSPGREHSTRHFGLAAARRRVPRPPVRSADLPRPGCRCRLRGRRRDRGAALAGFAVEGRAAARSVHHREAARRRTVADRARRHGRGALARTPRRAALLLARRGAPRPPPASGARRSPASERRPVQHDHPRDRRARRPAAAAGLGRGKRLAAAQRVESRQREPVLRLAREAVRRSDRRRAVMAGAARGAARPFAQHPVQSSGSQRRLDEDGAAPRLRRPAVFPARVFLVQDGAAVRLREVHARRRRPRADLPAVVQHPESRAAACPRRTSRSRWPRRTRPRATSRSGGFFGNAFGSSSSKRRARRLRRAGRAGAAEAARARGVVCPICVGDRRRRAFRIGAHGARRQQHRLLSRAADRRTRCGPAPCMPIRTGTS